MEAFKEAKEKAKTEAVEKATKEAEERVHKEAEEKARLEAEAEENAHREAEEKARIEVKAKDKARKKFWPWSLQWLPTGIQLWITLTPVPSKRSSHSAGFSQISLVMDVCIVSFCCRR